MIPAPDFGSKFISSRKPRLHDVSDRSDVTLASFKAPLLICCQVNKRTGRWPCTKPFPEVASQPPFHKPALGTYLFWRCCQDGKNTSRMLTAPLQLWVRSARFLYGTENLHCRIYESKESGSLVGILGNMKALCRHYRVSAASRVRRNCENTGGNTNERYTVFR